MVVSKAEVEKDDSVVGTVRGFGSANRMTNSKENENEMKKKITYQIEVNF